MSKMYPACDSEGTTEDDAHTSLTWTNSISGKYDQDEKSSFLDGEMDWLNMDLSPCSTSYGTPLFSRESSFSSFASCFSNLGGSLMDTDSEQREEEIELVDTGQLYPDIVLSDEFIELEKRGLIEKREFQPGYATVDDEAAGFPISASQNISSSQLQLDKHEDATKENINNSNNISDTDVSSDPRLDILSSNQFAAENVGSLEDINFKPSNIVDIEMVTSLPVLGSEILPLKEQLSDQLASTKENTIVYNDILDTDLNVKSGADLEIGSDHPYPLVLTNFDTDPFIWLPPEPADKEDEIDSVANNDDDGDNGGTMWGQSSFTISFDEESGKENHEEQLKKSMSEVMNGQFKSAVSHFLAAEGFSLSDGGTGKSWINIITSLSWEAALLVKPDASVGMDPRLYVKVKCIASGSCQQSEVIKGLVFKKSAALKQMHSNIKHPKLLLLQGALGCSSVGLSSMNSMKQENELLEKTLNELIGKCHPDVILVEKAVSHNVSEYMQKQGVTVVSDMNIRRLERIACCTGSSIITLQDGLTKSILKQCEYLHFEKLVQEHNIIGEDGRRSHKTFLFLEGFPNSLGCTILLKGATTEELKKIKHVLHSSVFEAYHLILKTSFFADQRLFLTDKIGTRKKNFLKTDAEWLVASCAASPSKFCSDGSTNSGTAKHDSNIPTSDEQHADRKEYVLTETSPSLHPHDVMLKSTLNGIGYRDPVEERLADSKGIQSDSSLPVPETSTDLFGDILSSDCVESTSYDAFDEARDQTTTFPVTLKEAILQKKEVAGKNCSETVDDGMCTETGTALNPHNILISMSSQHIRKQAVCEQTNLSQITYHGYCDTSLGRYLQDTLLNKNHSCLSCGEPPESHMLLYTHHNGTLTVLVKSLPLELTLSGEGQGRIWLWTRCLRCNGKPTQRAVISSSAHNLSFRKFLELSFSTHSTAKKLSTCGHLLHRDCLQFFGLGSKVAMFRYSSVEIYSACKPPMALEFHSPNKKEWLDTEVKSVLHNWKLLFSEIENIIQDLKSRCSGQVSEKNTNLVYEDILLEVTKMLMQEKNEVEASLEVFDHILKPETCVHGILGLNWMYQHLLLGFYIWDLRLNHLLHYKLVNAASPDSSAHESILENELQIVENSEKLAVHGNTQSFKNLEMEREDITIGSSNNLQSSCDNVISQIGQLSEHQEDKSHISPGLDVRLSSSAVEVGGNGSDQLDTSIKIAKESCLEKMTALPVKSDEQPASDRDNEVYPVAVPSIHLPMLPNSINFACDGTKWVWNRFSLLEMEYKKQLKGGSLEKFHLVNTYTLSSSSLAQLKKQMDLVHFTVGPSGNILSIAEEEISSIVAYALAISEEQVINSEITFVKDELEAQRKFDKVTPSNSVDDISKLSSIFSPNGSLEEKNRSSYATSLSAEESTSGFYDSFVPALKDLHPEICLNSKRVPLKSKYTVVSIYAKQFYNLRKLCCPSELTYILSISRCKKWKTEGGKSKAFFAKTMDDRFIIKEIKKTEFDSFLKFGLEYFKYVGASQGSRNPTCLAKILGVYQVKKIKNGKEKTTNLIVMENLLFGHNILRIYDLKGALFSRYVSDPNSPEDVLLDKNLIEDMRTMPVYIEVKTKNIMLHAIWNDTSFLSCMNVMDYSLLVGVDKQKKELVFGIIDYLRQYTWDKKLESWVKTSLVVPKDLSPTVISPKEYRIRFSAFMAQYFLSVPDA